MAKLNYVEGDYKEALNIYARVGLDDLPLTAVPPYRLRMIAEAYATKGEPTPSLLGGCPPGPCCMEPTGRPYALAQHLPARLWGWAHSTSYDVGSATHHSLRPSVPQQNSSEVF